MPGYPFIYGVFTDILFQYQSLIDSLPHIVTSRFYSWVFLRKYFPLKVFSSMSFSEGGCRKCCSREYVFKITHKSELWFIFLHYECGHEWCSKGTLFLVLEKGQGTHYIYTCHSDDIHFPIGSIYLAYPSFRFIKNIIFPIILFYDCVVNASQRNPIIKGSIPAPFRDRRWTFCFLDNCSHAYIFLSEVEDFSFHGIYRLVSFFRPRSRS